MFGGIAAGADRLAYATFDGTVVHLDPESGDVTGQFAVYPGGPAKVHVSACVFDGRGGLLLGDARNRRVRRFASDGRPLGLLGGLPNPGLEDQDEDGILAEPCAVLPLEGAVLVASGGFGMRHGVQAFHRDGRYLFSLEAPEGGWRRAQGLARLGEEVWVAETEAGRIRRHAPDGRYLDAMPLPGEIGRPLRLEADGFGGAYLLLAPESETEQETFGVARLDASGAFAEWAVRADEEAGVYCPFDVAALQDGRFVVADLPLGQPPEVRLRLFAPDGRLLRSLFEDTVDLAQAQRRWFQSVLAREDTSPPTLYEQARVHHYYAGATRDHLEKAGALYRATLADEPGHLLAHLGLAALLHRGLEDPEAAEKEYEAALEAGGGEGDLLARMAECRHDEGDLDGAIRLLEQAIAAQPPPEDYHDRVEDLGSYYLERAGESV